MHGGMVSAITAEAASKATALARVLPRPPRRRNQHRAHRRDIGHLRTGNAGEDDHRQHHHDVEPAANPSDEAFEQRDQTNGHAVRLHQVADEDEERDREQDEIVDAARHLLGEDQSRQRAVDPDVDQRGERQRKADRARRRPGSRRSLRASAGPSARRPPRRSASRRPRRPDASATTSANARSGGRRRQNCAKRENRHAERAGAHRIEGQFQRQAGAGGLPGGETPERNRVPRHRCGGHQHDQRRHARRRAGGPAAAVFGRRRRRRRSRCGRARPPRRRSSAPP